MWTEIKIWKEKSAAISIVLIFSRIWFIFYLALDSFLARARDKGFDGKIQKLKSEGDGETDREGD